MERVEIGHQGHYTLFESFAMGILNEFSIARNHFSIVSMDYPYLILLTIQLVILYMLIRYKPKENVSSNENYGINKLKFFSLAYLISIIIISVISPIDSFDYRILAPFTIPLFVGLLADVAKYYSNQYFDKYSKYIIIFMIVSLLVNLPKMYIIEEIRQFINQLS